MLPSNTRDKAHYELSKFEFKKFDGKLFIDNEYVGSV